MVNFGKAVYPAFVQQDDEGEYGVYFPTLFPEAGWEYPLSRGKTKKKSIINAKKDLAYSLAGILYDNEDLPKPIPIQSQDLTKGMELIDVETTFASYAEEIQKHLKGRHWHVGYYAEDMEYIEAIGFKNDQGTWDIFYEDYDQEDRNSEYHEPALLFTVRLQSEAEAKFKQYVEDVILKRSGNKDKEK